MKIVKQNWTFMIKPNWIEMVRLIDTAGKLCYKNEKGITVQDSKVFVKKLINMGHYSVIEHASISVKLITDRGVTHELVRHRLASYSQESTRWCNYSKDKFDGQITFIDPTFELEEDDLEFLRMVELHYMSKLRKGKLPQDARYFLPNGLKTEIVMTANVREWRHVFTLRCSPKAHPQIRELMLDMLRGFKSHVPVIFDDIYDMYCFDKDK